MIVAWSVFTVALVIALTACLVWLLRGQWGTR